MEDERVSETANEIDGQAPKNPSASDGTLIHEVARTVGAALGTIASETAKLLGSSRTKDSSAPKIARSKMHSVLGHPSPTDDKRALRRLESYRKKNARHRQKLKRSRTKG
jgi:hypothetical protein